MQRAGWNLTIERQITSEWLVRLAYVGSRGFHQRRTMEMNPAVYSPGVSASTTDARRMFAPYYGTMTGYWDNGVTRYNSFQASLPLYTGLHAPSQLHALQEYR